MQLEPERADVGLARALGGWARWEASSDLSSSKRACQSIHHFEPPSPFELHRLTLTAASSPPRRRASVCDARPSIRAWALASKASLAQCEGTGERWNLEELAQPPGPDPVPQPVRWGGNSR